MGKAGEVVLGILAALGEAMMEAQRQQGLLDAFGSHEWIQKHAPNDLEKLYSIPWIGSRIKTSQEVDLVVISVDIRKSTTLMKEAIQPVAFAQTMTEFVKFSQTLVRSEGGWFDKFMGDGFLAYWVCDEATKHAATIRALRVAAQVHDHFAKTSMIQFMHNSRNWPDGIGVACGLDAGPGHLILTVDGPTIMGPPVVGAVRMQGVAKPAETISNIQFARTFLLRQKAIGAEGLVDLQTYKRKTKEFNAQHVYELKPKPEFFSWALPVWQTIGGPSTPVAAIPAQAQVRSLPPGPKSSASP